MGRIRIEAWALAAWALSAVGCSSPEPFVVSANDLEEQVSLEVMPDIASELRSSDGKLSLLVPAGAVSAPVTLTVARVKAEAVPEGIAGNVYVLGPPQYAFAAPARLRLDLSEGSSIDEEKVRPVWVDTGKAKYAVLSSWVYLPETKGVAGDVTALGAFGASQGGGPGYDGDSDQASIADEYLAQHQLAYARAAYASAAAENPGDLQARVGKAVTQLVMLPEHAAVDDVMTLCAEPLLDVESLVFGTSGLIAHDFTGRMGFADLELQRGAATAAMSAVTFVPNSVLARHDEWQGDAGPESELGIELADQRSGDTNERIRFTMTIRNASAEWHDGAIVAFPYAGGDLWLGLSIGTIDGSDPYVDTWIQAGSSGSVQVVKAGYQEGEPVELVLDHLQFERHGYDALDNDVTLEVFELSGTVRDVVGGYYEPPAGHSPFADIEDRDYVAGPPVVPARSGIVQLVESCGPTLTVPYLQEKLDLVVGEIDAARAELDAVAQDAGIAGFSWSLPTGSVGNSRPVPVGPVEVLALRGLLYAVSAANAAVQQYRFLDTAPSALMTDVTPYYENMGCTWVVDHWDCSPQAIVRHDLDLDATAVALNAQFLVPVGTLDMQTEVKPMLAAAIASLKAALQVQPTAAVLVDFQRNDTARTAAAELVRFADLLTSSLDTPTAFPLSPSWELKLVDFLTAPFTRGSLLGATGLSAMWSVTPRDDVALQNAGLQLASEIGGEVLQTLVTMPAGPADTVYCVLDADCGNPDWRCGGWDGAGGVCSEDMTTPCTGTCAVGSCIQSTCILAAPKPFDSAKLDPAFQGDPPAFVDEALFESLRGAF